MTKQEALVKFQEAFSSDKSAEHPEWDEKNWSDMAYGFFVALGLSFSDASDCKLIDAAVLDEPYVE